MKKMYAVCLSMLVSTSVLVSQQAYGRSGVNIKDGKPAIIKVYGEPVGIESNFGKGKCGIQYGVLPMNGVKVEQGKSLTIEVIGGNNIIIQCNGNTGITISRD